ncbi:NAD-dependent epimerase/dehydratase family protein [Gordonia sp. DT219]|uniref:NAD-dependent epimerase/dehydratase family protein n=1 Tax=Gordonia sp. DT219 TaxID=3416658 RepID=UPI003CF246F7
MSRVLVTGAAGFIGSRVCAILAGRGHEVIGVDAMLPSAHLADTPPPDGVSSVDINDPAGIDAALAGVDVVSHQAALVGLGVGFSDAPEFARHNDSGTATLLAAMARKEIARLVIASSMVVYGNGSHVTSDGLGVTEVSPRNRDDLAAGVFDHRGPHGQDTRWTLTPEDAPLRPQNHYAASKAAQEHYARAWANCTGGSAVALRYHNVYGPNMPRDTPYAGVASIFRSALAGGRPPRVFEDGRQMRDFVHVDDVASANVMAIESLLEGPGAMFCPLNIASGHPISIGEVATILSDELSGPVPVITGEFRAGDVRHVVADPARAADVLGFRARIDPQSGLRAFAKEPLRETAGAR